MKKFLETEIYIIEGNSPRRAKASLELRNVAFASPEEPLDLVAKTRRARVAWARVR